MAIEQDLKIFISWSGDLAREITKVLRAWLPKMFDHIDPWASDVDIDAGTRGLDVIQERLNASGFGIIVVTTENMEKAWLNFEAGALSKRLEDNTNRVIPLLVNFDDVYQVTGPIRQFQAVKLDQEGMRGLCRSIARVIGLEWPDIEARFDWSWDSFAKEIEAAKALVGEQPEPKDPSEKDLLVQLLSAVNGLSKGMRARPSVVRPADLEATLKPIASQQFASQPRSDDFDEALTKVEAAANAAGVTIRETEIRHYMQSERPSICTLIASGTPDAFVKFVPRTLELERRYHVEFQIEHVDL